MSILRIELAPKLLPIFAPQRGEVRYRCMKGGRGSGKSFSAAKMAAIWGAIEPLRILCVREFQNSIAQSFHAELKNAISSCEWLKTQYHVGVDYLKHKTNGTEFIFKGLSRNVDSVKSLAKIDLVICEEAETIPIASWTDLLPTIREPRSEVWIIWNPKSPTSWVAQTFDSDIKPPRTVLATVNHQDNPWFSVELEEQRQHAKETMSASWYNHVWEGQYLLDDESSVIKSDWVEAAIDAHLLIKGMDTGKPFMGFDVADDGADKCATVGRTGSVATDSDEWAGREDELLKSAGRAYHNAQKLQAEIIYDSIGVGAGAGAQFNVLNSSQPSTRRLKHSKFNAGAGVFRSEALYDEAAKIKNKDYFYNLKAQAWWLVADRFRLTYQVVQALKNGTTPPKFTVDQLISIDSRIQHLDTLKMELSLPKREIDNNGRVKVESKKDLAKRGVPSTNCADAFIMAFAPVQSGITINPGLIR